MKHLANIDLSKNQLMNAATHNLASAPADPVEGQAYFNTTSKKEFYWNGTDWIQRDGTGATMTGSDIVTAINGSSSIIDLDNLPSALGNTSGTNTGDETATSIGVIAAALTEKTTPVDADTIPLTDSAATNVLKKVTWANIKSVLKTYFDTLYGSAGASHTQNTDTGTSSATFQLEAATGVKLKNSSGVLEVRNAADNAYANLRVNDLIVDGTTTTINSNEVNIGDAEILLNADITTNAANSDGGIAVKRLMADNTTPKNAKMIYNTSTERWEMVFGAVAGTLVQTPVVGKYAVSVGTGALTQIDVTHGLNTRDVIVQLREVASPYAEVVADNEALDANTVRLKFAVAPTTDQYRCIITG